MLKTVTAGGFFSLGGITAVDVHGATVAAPIFADSVVAFNVMGAPMSQVLGFGEDGAGELYVCGSRSGESGVYRITPITITSTGEWLEYR